MRARECALVECAASVRKQLGGATYVHGCNKPGSAIACGDEEDRTRARGCGICVRMCAVVRLWSIRADVLELT